MSRREFLTFRITPAGRTLEVSCRNLYMLGLDSESIAVAAPSSAVIEHEPWMGEPPTQFTRVTDRSMLDQLDVDLQSADVVRLFDVEWLPESPTREAVESILAAFTARGGRVESDNSKRVNADEGDSSRTNMMRGHSAPEGQR